MKRVLVYLCLAVVAGCGSSTNSASVTGNLQTAPLPTVLQGRVVNETGTVVSGARVVAEERTTNAHTEGLSGSDGTFSLSVPAGVYDLGIDNENDTQAATCFYGPITVSATQGADYVLHSGAGRPADQVFGKISIVPGTPAAGVQVSLRSATVHADSSVDVPDVVTTTTASDGTFSAQLGVTQEDALDVEVYDANGVLNQFVDIAKRAKPCYVEFSTAQSPIHNSLRAGESEIPQSGQPIPVTSLRLDLATAIPVTTVVVPPFTQFTASINATDTRFAQLENGAIPVSNPLVRRNLSDIVVGGTPTDPNYAKLWGTLDYGNIAVGQNGSWWWKYAVNIKADRPTRWYFTDQTNDTYGLWISNTNGGHKVSYNSGGPAIMKIHYRLSDF